MNRNLSFESEMGHGRCGPSTHTLCRPRFGWPFTHPATAWAESGPKMTGLVSPSFPTGSPTPAGHGNAGFCRKPTDFRRKIPAVRSPPSGRHFW
ncbi:unnamed protein product [Prunus brigantina]